MSKFTDIIEILFLMGIKEWNISRSLPLLSKIDFQLFLSYFWRFPSVYIFKERKGLGYPHGNFLFGETPYYTANEIVDIAEIKDTDIVYDLGCGRGKFLFFASCSTNARCIGIDLIPTYIDIAEKIVEKLELRNIDFFREDILSVDLTTASVIFINGTYFSPETHEALLENVKSLKKGTKIISSTIPYPSQNLELFAKKDILFSWARTPVYFYRVC